MKVCPNDDCPVHTYLENETLTYCPNCDTPGRILLCPECLGTGVRLIPKNDRTIVCTGCEYRIDLDEETPAFLGWIEKQTEQSSLDEWGQPKTTWQRNAERGGWSAPPEGTVDWHLASTRDRLRNANPHDYRDAGLADTDPNRLFIALLTISLTPDEYDPAADLQQSRAAFERQTEDGGDA